MDKGRKADLSELKQQPQTKKVKEAIKSINEEQKDSWKVSAREALIREKRKGNAGNVRDISEEIFKSKNKPGIGKTAFSINWPEHLK